MAEEGFLRRWARRKTESRQAADPADEAAPASAVPPAVPATASAPAAAPDAAAPGAAAPGAAARALPSLDDVAGLTPDADFSAFVARGVDPAVRRGALKKLFADPHFHAMDGLDVYIDDYTKPSPVPAAMLASLAHAQRALRPLLGETPPPAPAAAQSDFAQPEPAQRQCARPEPDPAPASTTPPEQETQ